MELAMNPAGEWRGKILERIYSYDAQLFIHHTEAFYMAICTPDEPSDEFIISGGP